MLLLLLACGGKPDDTATNDRDGDGVPDSVDCAPDDPATGAPPRQYVDADRDGYGDARTMDRACPGTPGYSEDGTDCDDHAASVHPGAPEIWYDGADEDCAGDSDFDQDHDGRDHPADCDDRDPAIPAAVEDCATPEDDDCSGTANDRDAPGCVELYTDTDGDGYGTGPAICQCGPEGDVRATVGGDCDDADGARFPGAFERCDGQQNACDGSWGNADEVGLVTSYAADGTVGDATSAWAEGTASSPVSLALPADGEVHVCAGVWYVRLAAPGDGTGATVRGVTTSGTVTLDGAGGRVLTLVDDASPAFTVSDVTMKGGYGDYGGGVYAANVDLRLERVTLTGNTATVSGGGVYASGGSLTLADSRVSSNLAPAGAGLFLYDTSLTASGTIDGNAADRSGGAYGGGLVWAGLTGATLDLTNLTVSGNTATSARGQAWSGGIYVEDQAGAPIAISGLTLSNNAAISTQDAAMGGGGYVRLSTGTLTMSDVTVASNSALGTTASYAGGLDIYGDGASPTVDLTTFTVTDNVVQGDSSSGGGGMAVSLFNSPITLTDATFTGNLVRSTNADPLGSGGGLNIGTIGGSLRLDGVTARGNTAGTGAGALVWGSGGAPVDIAASSFDDNVFGGGLMYVSGDTAATLDVSGTSCSGNEMVGLWVYAPEGTLATVSFTGREAADSNLDGNDYGLLLTCGDIGGDCAVTAASIDFRATRGSNRSCDLYYDGSCATRLGDDVAVSCSMADGAAICGW